MNFMIIYDKWFIYTTVYFGQGSIFMETVGALKTLFCFTASCFSYFEAKRHSRLRLHRRILCTLVLQDKVAYILSLVLFTSLSVWHSILLLCEKRFRMKRKNEYKFKDGVTGKRRNCNNLQRTILPITRSYILRCL